MLGDPIDELQKQGATENYSRNSLRIASNGLARGRAGSAGAGGGELQRGVGLREPGAEGEAELAELDALDVEDALLQKEIEELEPGFTTQSKEEVVVMPDVPKMKPVPKMPANVKKIASTEEEELEALRAEMELLG